MIRHITKQTDQEILPEDKLIRISLLCCKYRGADKTLPRPGRKQATVTKDFDVHISYL